MAAHCEVVDDPHGPEGKRDVEGVDSECASLSRRVQQWAKQADPIKSTNSLSGK